MKPIKTNLLSAAFAIIAMLPIRSWAQSVVQPSVLGSGATAASNGSYRLSGTAGQPLIGVASNSAQRNEAGFWYQVDRPIGNNSNQPPVVINAIANQNLVIGGAPFTIDLNTVFRDPDGDFLLYTAASGDPGKATAMLSGSRFTVTAVAIGNTRITVTADDQKGGTAVTDFIVTVIPPPNQPPVVANVISDRTLTLGNAPFGRDLNAAPPVFSDPDGDVLSYSATSSDPSKATATNSGSTLTVAPVAAGSTTIIVTANDNKGGTVSTTFTMTVAPANRPPMVVNAIPNQNLTIGGTSFVCDLNMAPTVFSDPDGDALTYTASSSAPAFATANISASALTVAPVAAGSATITLIANDGKGSVAQTAFVVTVNPRPIYWTYDTFDPLNLGSLHGQNGWVTVAGSSPASVVLNPSGAGKVMELKAPVGGKIFMSKAVSAALSGTQTLELKVRVEQPNSASMAKLEVNTNNGTFWDKKFQIYFGSGMRLNNSPSSAVNFLPQTVPQQWYTLKVVFNLGTNLLDLYLDGVLVLNDITIGAGAITGIAVTGFSASPNYALLDDILGYTGGLVKAKDQNVAAEPAETMPSSFELAQNYPNPFNPETTIQYAIPSEISSPVHVTLRIYNLQGQLVRTLVDEQKSPGRYRVVWDGKNDLGIRIATGMYLYTISAGEFKATKRMTILK